MIVYIIVNKYVENDKTNIEIVKTGLADRKIDIYKSTHLSSTVDIQLIINDGSC